MVSLKRQANQNEVPVALDERQRAAAELLLKRGWVDAPPKSGSSHAMPWGDFRSKEELLAALPPLSAYKPPDSGD